MAPRFVAAHAFYVVNLKHAEYLLVEKTGLYSCILDPIPQQLSLRGRQYRHVIVQLLVYLSYDCLHHPVQRPQPLNRRHLPLPPFLDPLIARNAGYFAERAALPQNLQTRQLLIHCMAYLSAHLTF